MEFNKFLRRELKRTQKHPEDIVKATAVQADRVLEILRGSEPTRREQQVLLEFLNGADRVSPRNDPTVSVVSVTE